MGPFRANGWSSSSSTESLIAVGRVLVRMSRGEQAVRLSSVIDSYKESPKNLPEVRKHTDDLILNDNTAHRRGYRVAAEFGGGELSKAAQTVPDWVSKLFGKELHVVKATREGWARTLARAQWPARPNLTRLCSPAARALRSSEILALRWADILWLEERIRVSKGWVKGVDGKTKTEASDGYVPLHLVLADHLRRWRNQTPYTRDEDFVFPSLKAHGRVPLSSSGFVADHLRPAAGTAGVPIQDGQRFGLHNLRRSLSNWLVNKARVEPKTVQGMPRHSRIQTTLDLYTQEDSDEARGAQGEFLKAVGVNSGMLQ